MLILTMYSFLIITIIIQKVCSLLLQVLKYGVANTESTEPYFVVFYFMYLLVLTNWGNKLMKVRIQFKQKLSSDSRQQAVTKNT